jgi:membrane-bound serine protease (ClpP class)
MALVVAIALAVFVLPLPWGLIAVGLALVWEIAELMLLPRHLHRRYAVRTGAEGLVGERAQVVERLDPEGRVRLRGEIWRARATTALPVGTQVEVTGVSGLKLQVASPREVAPGR